MVYTYNGILFDLKKEGNSAICDSMDGMEDFMLKEISHRKKNKYCMIPLI